MNIKIKFGIITVFIIIFQSILKVYGVLITGSLSFLSETVDTLTDILFVSLTIYSLYQSEKPADYEHMYGHKKYDSIGALVQGVILLILYFMLVVNAVQRIWLGIYEVNNPSIGLYLLIISFSVNLIFSRFLIWQSRMKKSLTLEIQGLNLFQDSMRAILVIVSFIFSLFTITFLDPYFSIVLSVWIGFGAFKLMLKGMRNLLDSNPINSLTLEELRQAIFELEHVNGIEDLKVRGFGEKLFLDARLSVEDHISVMHANEITKTIRTIGDKLLQPYEVEYIIEMNPLAGEKSIGESITNLIYSMKTEFPSIIDIKDLNIFFFKDQCNVSLTNVVDENLSLKEAHDLATRFERELLNRIPSINRITSHIEAEPQVKILQSDGIECLDVSTEKLAEIKLKVEGILKSNPYIRGYHGFEFWSALDYCALELHIFLDGQLNIGVVHNYISDLEKELRKKLKIKNLKGIILHSEPFSPEREGIMFNP
jgi:ferrous-iron efflux pump FieF